MTARGLVSLSAGESARLWADPRVAAAVVLTALGLQMFLPTVMPALHVLNLPLLATVYVVLRHCEAIAGMWAGMFIGWAQDSLTHGPIGMYGAVYVCLAYLAVLARQYLHIDVSLVLGAFVGLATLLHEAMLYAIRVYLLGSSVPLEFGPWFAVSALHAGLALLIFPLGDRVTRPR